MSPPATEHEAPVPTPVLVIMVKEPSGGAIEAWLSGGLGEAQRAELYRAFLLDKIDQVRGVEGAEPHVAFTPPSAREAFERLAPGVGLVAQRDGDLGERLAGVVEELGQGRGVLLVDSDTPNLPTGVLSEAVAALQTSDVVLGPAWDGGYYLIGLRRPEPALFEGIRWGSAEVLGQTVERARRLGLTVHFLPSWYDVDTPSDLDRLGRDLGATSPRPGSPRRTAEALARLRPAPPQPPPRSLHWSTLSSRRVYQNRWIQVDEAVVALPGGGLTLYGVVTCSRCVGVAPLLDDGGVVLVRQFRYVAQRWTWEIPTGGVHEGETYEQAAQRELSEEAGYEADRLEPLTAFHTSKSVVDETARLYLGHGLRPRRRQGDATEELQVQAFTLHEALAMVTSGEIVDSMSVIALLLLGRARGV